MLGCRKVYSDAVGFSYYKTLDDFFHASLWLCYFKAVDENNFYATESMCRGKLQSSNQLSSKYNNVFQVSALPRTLILLLLFLTAFIWISSILMLLLAVRLKWIFWDLSQSFSLRLAITVFTIVLLYSVGQVNVVRIIHLSMHDKELN